MRTGPDYPDAWEEGDTWQGRPIAAYSARAGDGIYRDNAGREYPVDASMIAAVPMDLIQDAGKAGRNGCPV